MQSFERDPLILMNDVARLMRTRFDQRARTFGMTRAQWVILARLERQPGLSQNEMATICEVEPITVGRLIDRLELRGLVERRPDPGDRKSVACICCRPPSPCWTRFRAIARSSSN